MLTVKMLSRCCTKSVRLKYLLLEIEHLKYPQSEFQGKHCISESVIYIFKVSSENNKVFSLFFFATNINYIGTSMYAFWVQ